MVSSVSSLFHHAPTGTPGPVPSPGSRPPTRTSPRRSASAQPLPNRDTMLVRLCPASSPLGAPPGRGAPSPCAALRGPLRHYIPIDCPTRVHRATTSTGMTRPDSSSPRGRRARRPRRRGRRWRSSRSARRAPRARSRRRRRWFPTGPAGRRPRREAGPRTATCRR